jgi:hypothetical protein
MKYYNHVQDIQTANYRIFYVHLNVCSNSYDYHYHTLNIIIFLISLSFEGSRIHLDVATKISKDLFHGFKNISNIVYNLTTCERALRD